jgi:hypothetical protein
MIGQLQSEREMQTAIKKGRQESDIMRTTNTTKNRQGSEKQREREREREGHTDKGLPN